jgi:hypothetical protein
MRIEDLAIRKRAVRELELVERRERAAGGSSSSLGVTECVGLLDWNAVTDPVRG